MKDKHFRVAALCLLCLLLPAVPVAAQDDGYVDIGENSNGIWSLYVPSVEEREHILSGRYVVGWVRVVLSDDGANELRRRMPRGISSNSLPAKVMYFYAANERFKQTQILSTNLYDIADRQIWSNSDYFGDYRWQECPPGTMDEAVWLALMKAAGYR